jgi:tetratricopeptide (TPR) repeat protein
MNISLRLTVLLGFALWMIIPGSLSAQDGESATRQAMSGRNLSAEAVRSLETQVKAAPDDLAARTQLLGYYMRLAFTSPEAQEARQQHILWLIRNQPDAPILSTPFARLDMHLDSSAYEEGRKAWLDQVDRQPKNAAILGSAAAYLLLSDSDAAASLYQRAEAAEPQNPEWSQHLGHLYSLGLARKTGEEKRKSAKASLAAYERSLAEMRDDRDERAAEERESLLPSIATVALEAGETAKARGYAEEMLKSAGNDSSGWNGGNLVHHGHLVLGRLALRDGDTKTAQEHLLAAGKTKGSPQLNSFGPNMTLAKELLEKGERQTVLEYLKLCGAFWKKSDLEAWTKEVQAGKMPDFGANLEY